MTVTDRAFVSLIPLILAMPSPLAGQITHGPVVGGVTSNSARILVRAPQNTISFQVSFFPDDFTGPLETATVEPDSARDYFAVIDVDGLNADTRYYYRAVLDSVAQADVFQFDTFPTEGVTPETYTFAFGACQQLAADPTSGEGSIWPQVAAAQPRFFLHLGDWGYPDSTDTPQNPTDFFNRDYSRVQASYRARYDENYPMADLFGTTSFDYVYDDHDYSDNNTDGTALDKHNTVRGYQEMFPHYPLSGPNPSAIYHSFIFGNAEFFVVDTRTQRDPNVNAFPNFPAWLADPTTRLVFDPQPSHSILGDAQMSWLIDGLTNSTATWKFIVTGVPFNPAHRAGVELALTLQGTEFDPVLTPDGELSAAAIAIAFSDTWGGFPHSSAQLAEAIHMANVCNVIVLSGDTHTAALDNGANALFPEFMSGGLDRTNSRFVALLEQFGLFAWNAGGQTSQQTNFNDHFGKVTVFGADSVRVDLIDHENTVIASHVVMAGHNLSPLSLTVAPQVHVFEADAGGTAVQPILLCNTSFDPLTVLQTLGLSDPYSVIGLRATPDGFEPDPGFVLPFQVEPGETRVLGIVFEPMQVGAFGDTLWIGSTDPKGPSGVVVLGTASPPTPVLVSDFTANIAGGAIELSWFVQEVADVAGFHVWRSLDGTSFAPANPSLLAPRLGRNVFRDSTVDLRNLDSSPTGPATLSYRLMLQLTDGRIVVVGGPITVDSRPSIARRPTLAQNTPNPFNPYTTISFSLPRAGEACLQIFDVRGRLVRELLESNVSAGRHSLLWDGRDSNGRSVASGVYVYRLVTTGDVLSRHMVVVR